MANIDAAFGLRPSRHQTGGSVVQNEHPIADAYVIPIYLGDPVILNVGNVELGAAAGVNHIGIFQGCEYVDPQGKIVFSKMLTNLAGCTEKKALVAEIDKQVFKIQADNGTTAKVGTAYDLIIAAGDATIGQSKSYLNTAATVGAAYKVIGIVNRDDNEEGDYAEVEVINILNASASS